MNEAIQLLADAVVKLSASVDNAVAKGSGATPEQITAVQSAAGNVSSLADKLNTAFGV